jgi:hypothetical protein
VGCGGVNNTGEFVVGCDVEIDAEVDFARVLVGLEFKTSDR